MIDELDVFNASVTLALARVARIPFKARPQLASEAGNLSRLAIKDRALEDAAFKWIFSRDKNSIYDIYLRFWDFFKFEPEKVGGCSVRVNAPPGAVVVSEGASVIDLRYDSRLGCPMQVPDKWTIPTETGSAGYVDDVVFFSDNGMPTPEMEKLVRLMGPGTSVTFVRPSKRCDPWFAHCNVQHNFNVFTQVLDRRAEIEQIHESHAADPVLVSVFGVQALLA